MCKVLKLHVNIFVNIINTDANNTIPFNRPTFREESLTSVINRYFYIDAMDFARKCYYLNKL